MRDGLRWGATIGLHKVAGIDEIHRVRFRQRFCALSRQQLLDGVWGHGWYGDERTVDVHVRQLRKKLGDALPLATVWGVGYRLE